MKITAIKVHQVDMPLREGRYNWSNENSISVFDSTFVVIETDMGLTGIGESCPLGPSYLPAYAAGVRAGLQELGPRLIGHDPLQTAVLNDVMDRALRGHPYVKSAIDVALWDLLGKVAGLPVHVLLGGAMQRDLALYRAISQDRPDAMAARVSHDRAEGYRKFQLKVGGDANDDIARIEACRAVLQPGDLLVADANTGWTMNEAARVVAAVAKIDVYIEQPCATYEECLAIRRRTALPFVLDEVITGVDVLLRAIADGAMDAVNLKISKLGGLTKAKLLRDICDAAGVAMTIEDSWGGDVVTAAIAEFAASTRADLLLSTTDFNSYGSTTTAAGAPKRVDGKMSISNRPGLGMELLPDVIGEPVLVM